MSRTVLDDEEMSMPRSTARSGTSSVRSTSRGGRRPTSAPNRRKQGATSRPSSVKPGATGRLSRLQDINHPGVRPGIPDSLKPKRKTGPPSGKFFTDPENMYAEIQKLKKQVHSLSEERVMLKTRVIRFDYELARKEKEIEDLLKQKSLVDQNGQYAQMRSENNLIKSLKRRVRSLESAVAEKEDDISRLKADARYTRVQELELELKTYYNESRRLQKLLDSQSRDHIMQAASLSQVDKKLENRLQLLQEKNMHHKVVNKNLRHEIMSLQEELERARSQADAGGRYSGGGDRNGEESELISDLRIELRSKDNKIELLELQNNQRINELEVSVRTLVDRTDRSERLLQETAEEKDKLQQLYAAETDITHSLRKEIAAMSQQVEQYQKIVEASDNAAVKEAGVNDSLVYSPGEPASSKKQTTTAAADASDDEASSP